MEIATSNLAQAGSFFTQIAIDTATIGAASSWYNADTLDLTIQLGFVPEGASEGAVGWQNMLSGRVDRMHFDPVAGLVTLEGRDYAARLLDLPVSETFLNCTSSDVAQQLSTRCGLSAAIDPTSTFVGQYYQIEHARLSLAPFSRFGTAWDLLSSLAQIEQYDLWVDDSTLNFRSAARSAGAAVPITFRTGGPGASSATVNASTLTVQRCLALAGDVPVVVASWNSRHRTRIQVQAGAGGGSGASAIRVLRPNLPADTAQALANSVSATALSHQRSLTATMAGDLTLNPRDTVRLTGLGAPWDGAYRVTRLERELTLHGGFVQRVSAQAASG